MPRCLSPHDNIIDVFLAPKEFELSYNLSDEEEVNCILPDNIISLDICSEFLKVHRHLSASGGIPVHVYSTAEVKKKSQFKEVSAEIAIEPAVCCKANIYIEPRLQAGIKLGNEVKANKTKYLSVQAGTPPHVFAELSRGIIPDNLEARVPVHVGDNIEVYRWTHVQDLYADSLFDIGDQDLQDLYYKKK